MVITYTYVPGRLTKQKQFPSKTPNCLSEETGHRTGPEMHGHIGKNWEKLPPGALVVPMVAHI